MDNCFIEIPNKLKERNKFWEFEPLVKLVDLTFDDNFKLWSDLKGLFFLTETSSHDFVELKKQILPKDDCILLDQIEKIFEDFHSSTYNFDNLKGAFLEVYIFKYLKEKYPQNTIKRECKVKYKDFNSAGTVDIGISFKNGASVYECKASTRYLKRSDLDLLSSIYRHSDECISTFLVVWNNQPSLERILKKLQNKTSEIKYNELLKNINFKFFDEFYLN